MALVTQLEPTQKERTNIHRPTRCVYCVVEDGDGAKFIQLDTMGSDDREIADKVSQSIQFNRQAAEQLLAIMKQAFPGIA
jgi:hypothetical protein